MCTCVCLLVSWLSYFFTYFTAKTVHHKKKKQENHEKLHRSNRVYSSWID